LTLADAVPDRTVDPTDTVARLLGHQIATHVGAVVLGWPEAYNNAPDGVHSMRVSIRRLRSALATGRPFLDRTFTEPIRDELGWLADALGHARDAEVQAARIADAVDALVSERADLDWEADRVRPTLLAPLLDRQERALDALRRSLQSRRYAELAQRLQHLVTDPPWTGPAQQPIGEAYLRRVRRGLRRLDKRMQSATSHSLDPDNRAAALHEARKVVKRTRYAVEPLLPVYDKRAKQLTKRLKKLQSRLGQLQDTVITRDYLHDLVRTQPGMDPSTALVAGALIEREATHGEAYEQTALHAWLRVTNTKPLS
jgi:CHAD domain-containing protein